MQVKYQYIHNNREKSSEYQNNIQTDSSCGGVKLKQLSFADRKSIVSLHAFHPSFPNIVNLVSPVYLTVLEALTGILKIN